MATSGTTAEQEFAKNPEIKQEDLQKLREWLKSQPHLPPVSDRQLILFYHSCYFNVENTKSCIETYYSIRTSAPEFFTNRDLDQSELQKALSVLNNVALPEKDPNGYAIIFHSLRDSEPSHYVFNDGVKLITMAVDGVLHREGTVPGFVFLFDMRGVKLMHLTRVGLSALRKFFTYIQEGMPVRLKAVHVINVLPLMDQVMALVKPFMKKELYNMLHFHKGDLEPFYEIIPKKCLPKDFGGDLPSIEELHEKHAASLKELKDYFQEEEKYRIDDSKRIKGKKSKCIPENNVPTFRNLAID